MIYSGACSCAFENNVYSAVIGENVPEMSIRSSSLRMLFKFLYLYWFTIPLYSILVLSILQEGKWNLPHAIMNFLVLLTDLWVFASLFSNSAHKFINI